MTVKGNHIDSTKTSSNKSKNDSNIVLSDDASSPDRSRNRNHSKVSKDKSKANSPVNIVLSDNADSTDSSADFVVKKSKKSGSASIKRPRAEDSDEEIVKSKKSTKKTVNLISSDSE